MHRNLGMRRRGAAVMLALGLGIVLPHLPAAAVAPAGVDNVVGQPTSHSTVTVADAGASEPGSREVPAGYYDDARGLTGAETVL